jgi:hypothetical protein
MYNSGMYVAEIIWLPEVLDKLDWKHGVSPAEVEIILFGRPLQCKVPRGHVPSEDRHYRQ